jgi:protein-tyrosine kinase
MHRDLPPEPLGGVTASAAPEREGLVAIGELIRRHRDLSAEQVEKILAHQRAKGMRFGEAAVALGLATEDDVVRALAHQFEYPVTSPKQAAFAPELVVAHRPFSPQAEVFRGIRAQLLMRLHGAHLPRRAVAVVSHDSGDGRSYFAANIAAAFSQLGGRTLLIDADLRSPRLHTLFGMDNATGLSNMLVGRGGSRTILSVPALPSLFVLPVGAVPPNPLELIERPVFAALIADVLHKFDHVVVDTPAFAHGMDSPVIAAKCGAALLLARRNRSHFSAMQDLVATLADSPVELAGVVVNEH